MVENQKAASTHFQHSAHSRLMQAENVNKNAQL
jgi:hypothetical protein